MKGRSATVLALGVGLALFAPSASFADSTPTPTPTPSTASGIQDAIDQYKIALEEYRADMSLREQNRKLITQNFLAAVLAANNVAKTAMRTAKTADTKSVILAQQKSSIAFATSLRDAAISAMGPAPLEPVKPAKPVQSVPSKKTKSEKPSPTPKK